MKIKLPEKLIAILLVFAIAFLTIPLAKADIIISLEENEETEEVSSAVVNTGETVGTRANYYLNWYSNSNYVGFWPSMPCLYYTKLDCSDSFKTEMQNAAIKWSSVLGITVNSSNANVNQSVESWEDYVETPYSLHYYGGSNDRLEDFDIFDDDDLYDPAVLGQTYFNSYRTHPDTITYDGVIKTVRQLIRVRGYVKDLGSLNEFKHVCMHELGHALGWFGHAANANDLMYTYYNNTTTPLERDKMQIKQIYDLFY